MRVVLALAHARGASAPAVGRPRIIIVLRVRVTKADSETGKAHNRFLAKSGYAECCPGFFSTCTSFKPHKVAAKVHCIGLMA